MVAELSVTSVFSVAIVDGGYLIERLVSFDEEGSISRPAMAMSREAVHRMLDETLDKAHEARTSWSIDDKIGKPSDGGEGKLVNP